MCSLGDLCYLQQQFLVRCCSEHRSSASECRAHFGEANTCGWWLTAAGTLPKGPLAAVSIWAAAAQATYELSHQPGTASLHPELHRSVSASLWLPTTATSVTENLAGWSRALAPGRGCTDLWPP